jgi:phage FluMu protein Com
MKCPRCKGSGKMTIKMSEYSGGKVIVNDTLEMKCFECKGTGQITEAEMKVIKAEKAMWCKCGNPSGQTMFVDDGESKKCAKHHWVCEDCGKITQIG